jgi:hypothetical protein
VNSTCLNFQRLANSYYKEEEVSGIEIIGLEWILHLVADFSEIQEIGISPQVVFWQGMHILFTVAQ